MQEDKENDIPPDYFGFEVKLKFILNQKLIEISNLLAVLVELFHNIQLGS